MLAQNVSRRDVLKKGGHECANCGALYKLHNKRKYPDLCRSCSYKQRYNTEPVKRGSASWLSCHQTASGIIHKETIRQWLKT